ncbi:MAG: response regulator [bacterium]|nr:response regulator [bacterium]
MILRILLVEDEGVISVPMQIVLESQNYKVDVACNGKEALDFCAKKTYDVILLDIMMPVMDGVEFLRKANLRELAPKTKIIVLSNLAMGGEINEAMELGADKSLLKSSITPGSLLALINQQIALF